MRNSLLQLVITSTSVIGLLIGLPRIDLWADETPTSDRYELLKHFPDATGALACINDRGEVVVSVRDGSAAGIWRRASDGEWSHAVSTQDLFPRGDHDIFLENHLNINERGELVFVTKNLDGQKKLWSLGHESTATPALVATFAPERYDHLQPSPKHDRIGAQALQQVLFCDAGRVTVTTRVMNDPSRDLEVSLWTAASGQSLEKIATGVRLSNAVAMTPSGDIVYTFANPTPRRADILNLWSNGARRSLIYFDHPLSVDGQSREFVSTDNIAVNGAAQTAFSGAGTVVLFENQTNQASSFNGRLSKLIPEREHHTLNTSMVLNARGDVVHYDTFDEANKPFYVCYLPATGEARVVAQVGHPTPGLAATFEVPLSSTSHGFRSPFANFGRAYDQVALSRQGHVAFVAGIRLNKSDLGTIALFASDKDANNLQLIINLDDEFMLSSGPKSSIKDIFFLGDTGNQDGRPSGMSDNGELVFAAHLEKQGVAILRSTLVASDAEHRPASPPVSADAERQHRQAVAQSLNEWKAVAESHLKSQMEDYRNSDLRTLTQLASDLRTEYHTERRRWEKLADDESISSLERAFRQENVRARLVELKQTWETLQVWPFSTELVPPKGEETQFELLTNKLLMKYGDVESVSKAVASVQEELSTYTREPIPRKFERSTLPNLRAGLPMLRRRSQAPLALFNAPIGPPLPPRTDVQWQSPLPINAPEPGPLSDHPQCLDTLVRIAATNDGRLQVDRRYWMENDWRTQLSRINRVESLLRERHVSDELAFSRLLIRQHLQKNDIPTLTTNAITARFAMLGVQYLDQTGSTPNAGDLTHQFETDSIRGSLQVSTDKFKLELTELVPSSREFRIAADDNSRTFSLSINAKAQTLQIDQEADGTIRMVAGPWGNFTTHSAINFAELYAQNPDDVEAHFIDRCRQFGIGGLLIRSDSAVHQAVLRRLKAMEAGEQRTRELLGRLASFKTFDDWYLAQQELSLDFKLHEELLRAARNDESTPDLARQWIDSILVQRSEGESQLDWIIRELQLLDDADYLKTLSAKGEDVERIRKRIESLD